MLLARSTAWIVLLSGCGTQADQSASKFIRQLENVSVTKTQSLAKVTERDGDGHNHGHDGNSERNHPDTLGSGR